MIQVRVGRAEAAGGIPVQAHVLGGLHCIKKCTCFVFPIKLPRIAIFIFQAILGALLVGIEFRQKTGHITNTLDIGFRLPGDFETNVVVHKR